MAVPATSRSLSAEMLIATGFGFGYAPRASGTVGALVGIPLVLGGAWLPAWYWQLPGLLMLLGLAVWTAGRASACLGSHDPKPVVIDEIVSLPVTFVGIPLDALSLAVGFVLNRAMDILKLPPARQLERLPAGWGIVADDLASALYANGLMQVFSWWLHRAA